MIKCVNCSQEYTEAQFRAAHPGPHVETALKVCRTRGVAIVNCAACPVPQIAASRPGSAKPGTRRVIS